MAENKPAVDYSALEEQRKLPYSLEAEQAVLGKILINPETFSKVAGILTPDSFYIDRHKVIFSAMSELFNLSEPIEPLRLLEILRDNGDFRTEEDKMYLVSLAETASVVSKTEYYIRVVKEKYTLRKTIEICEQVGKMCYENENPEKVLDIASQKLFDLESNENSGELETLQHLVRQEFNRIQEMKNDTTGKFDAIKVGISDFDAFVGGLNKSDLVILAARPGVGKTSFALNVAYNIAISNQFNPKKTVVFFSLEMSKEQLARRVISTACGIDHDALQKGTINDNQWSDLWEFCCKRLAGTSFKFDETSTITVAEMKAKLRREKNLGLVVIDYLQLMGSGVSQNRVQEIADYTRSIKLMAKELHVPVILLSQLSRGITNREDKTPQLSDLRDSGSIEQDADVVIFLDRPETYAPNTPKKGICTLWISKNRHGKTGHFDVHWDGSHTRFNSIDRSLPPNAIPDEPQK